MMQKNEFLERYMIQTSLVSFGLRMCLPYLLMTESLSRILSKKHKDCKLKANDKLKALFNNVSALKNPELHGPTWYQTINVFDKVYK